MRYRTTATIKESSCVSKDEIPRFSSMFGRPSTTVAGGQMYVLSSGVVWRGRRQSQRQEISPVSRLEVRYKCIYHRSRVADSSIHVFGQASTLHGCTFPST